MAQAIPGFIPDDPYALDPAAIKDPPKGWGESIKFLGPGMILTASIVGSGELIATTTMGAQVGFAVLWMVLFSCAVKVALQIEIARWTIATGTPALAGYNKVPPMIWKLSWVNWTYFILFLSKLLQVGGILGGVALAFNIMFPINLQVWVAITCVGTIALLYSNAYNWVEKGAFYLVVVFSIVTVLIAFGLPFTPLGYSAAEVASGLTFAIPAGTIAVVLGMFGITGVGADEITIYNYWCLEKGYARWTGPRENSEAWLKRAQGWLDVMYKDVSVSLIIYTFATMAFFLMGASVLHRQKIVPSGNDMIIVFSRMYTDTLGPWAMYLFLIGAIAVLGSTLWAAVPSNARAYSNWMSLIWPQIWADPKTRMKFIRGWTVVLPILYSIIYLFLQSPVLMVQIGGVMTGIFLVAVVAAAWYLRSKETDKRLHGSTVFNVLLLLSSIAIGFLGVYSILNVLGFKIA